MKERGLLLVVVAGLLIGAVIVAVEAPDYYPYEPEVLEFSLEKVTVIRVDDAEWAKGTWFDWDPLHTYDLCIIAEPC